MKTNASVMPAPSHSIVRVIPRASDTARKRAGPRPAAFSAAVVEVSDGDVTAISSGSVGSMYALTKSMTTLATTTTSAKTMMIPWTAA